MSKVSQYTRNGKTYLLGYHKGKIIDQIQLKEGENRKDYEKYFNNNLSFDDKKFISVVKHGYIVHTYRDSKIKGEYTDFKAGDVELKTLRAEKKASIFASLTYQESEEGYTKSNFGIDKKELLDERFIDVSSYKIYGDYAPERFINDKRIVLSNIRYGKRYVKLSKKKKRNDETL